MLIPAHNEGVGILPTLRDVQAQLGPADHVLVVADNCSDDTAEIARAAGAEVVVRHDPERRGKGYALEFGVQHLASDPPDVVVILDADCRLDERALSHLSANAMASGRPIQSLYLMLGREGEPTGTGVKLFAWRIKNWLRPLGQKLLGMPTQLFGTGMAFPFGLLAGRDLGNSRLAEDTALGLALAIAGRPPLFVSEARIHSTFPCLRGRRRMSSVIAGRRDTSTISWIWCRGRCSGRCATGTLPLAALAIDLTVPPLSLLVLITVACAFLGRGRLCVRCVDRHSRRTDVQCVAADNRDNARMDRGGPRRAVASTIAPFAAAPYR